ncbi:MAG: hypothetical protein OEZ06_21690 [Myxococcales bacterium]|nr:hypothetical protein [Myxococcales bacterium]
MSTTTRFINGAWLLALGACTQPVTDVAVRAEALVEAPEQADRSWSMALYDAVASGHNPRERSISPQNVDQLEFKWRFDEAVAGHEVGPIHATPVVRARAKTRRSVRACRRSL